MHPGGLHTQADLDRMKTKVAAKESPWIDGWNVLIKDRKAQSDYKASPHRHMASRQRAQDDANAAYLNALRWYISGEKEHAECAVRILNDWADAVSEIPHGNDQPGLSGIPIGTVAMSVAKPTTVTLSTPRSRVTTPSPPDPSALTYRVRAYNTGGFSTYSDVASHRDLSSR